MNNNHSGEENVIMQKFFTIRADVKQSTINKKYRDLKKIVSNVNDDLSIMFKNDRSTLIELTVRKGDELFAIYGSQDIAFEALQLILVAARTYKVPLYVGCGYGEIEDISDDENLVNGVSIWRATNALNDVSAGRPKYNEKFVGDIVLKIMVTENNKINDKYQTLLYLLAEKVLKRTPQQNKAVMLLKKYPQKEYDSLYNLLEGLAAEEDSSAKEDKKIKFIKYLQRADYLIVNDLVEVIIKNIEKEDL